MKPPFLILLILACSPLAVCGQNDRSGAKLEFSAVLQSGREVMVVVTEVGSKQVSPWLKTGDSFLGVTIGAYDPSVDALTIERDGRSARIFLKAGKVQDGTSEAKTERHFRFTVLPGGTISNDGVPTSPADLVAIFRLVAEEGVQGANITLLDAQGAAYDGSKVRAAALEIRKALRVAGLRRITMHPE